MPGPATGGRAVTGSDLRPCPDWSLRLHGFVDGELDAAHALQCERHLAECAGCAAEVRSLKALRGTIRQEGVRWPVLEALRARVLASIAEESMGAAPAAAPGSLAVEWRAPLRAAWLPATLEPRAFRGGPRGGLARHPVAAAGRGLQDELVASHVRSLLADHLTDVATSDQHTRQTVVRRPDRFLAAGSGPHRPRIPAARRPRRLCRRPRRRGADLPAQRPHHQRLRLARGKSHPRGLRAGGLQPDERWQAGLSFWAVSDLNTVELEEFQDDFSEVSPK